MANAKICDNCKKIIDEVSIKLTGYTVTIKGKLRYEIQEMEDLCSFNCLIDYAKKQQEFLEESSKIIKECEKKGAELPKKVGGE